MRSLVILMCALIVAGCAHREEITPISPSPVGQRPADFGLGPGVRPLSSGPGDKGSPSWSPSGESLAFVVDGYVVEKQPNEPAVRRQTTRDLGAEKVAWTSPGQLRILAQGPQAPPENSAVAGAIPSRTVYGKTLDESLDVNELAASVTAIAPILEGNLLVASRTGSTESQLAIVSRNGSLNPLRDTIEGAVMALSVVPAGDRAIVAVRKPGPERNFEILSYSFAENNYQTLTRLRDDLRIFGAPQWTSNGIYYVAGEYLDPQDETSVDYTLYRLAPGSSQPVLAPGVGEDFVASSLKRSPEGDLLAVTGRRNSSSPVNLYVLRPGVGDLVAATTNENMEIKTETEDLAWSNNGDRVTIVARTMLSEPRVYDVPADALVSDFYNIYEVPIEKTTGGGAA